MLDFDWEEKKDWLFKKIIEFKVRQGRGQHWFSEIKEIAYYMVALKILFDVGLRVGLPLVIVAYFALYLVGWLDFYKGIWRSERRYKTEIVNPYYEEILERVKKIEEEIDSS